MRGTKAMYLPSVVVLLVAVTLVSAGCGGSTSPGAAVTTTTAGAVGATIAPTTTMAPTTTSVAPTTTLAATATSTAAATTTSMVVSSPFTKDDLRGLVLAESEGNGLVEGLSYRSRYSGTATPEDVRHWTLAAPERLQAAGFVTGYNTLFFTDDFYSTNAKAGRSLLTAAFLFPTPEAAAQALKVFSDTRDQSWKDMKPLSPVPSAETGIAMTGRLGSDNVTDLYPSIGFSMQVANICLLVGSQGGAQSGQPLPEDLMRSIAEKLLTRAQDRLGQIQK
jgi:hypothetical protein